jgi:hypothetical protein
LANTRAATKLIARWKYAIEKLVSGRLTWSWLRVGWNGMGILAVAVGAEGGSSLSPTER